MRIPKRINTNKKKGREGTHDQTIDDRDWEEKKEKQRKINAPYHHHRHGHQPEQQQA